QRSGGGTPAVPETDQDQGRLRQREQLTEAAVCRYTQSVRTLNPSDTELEPHAVAADDPLPRPAGRLHQLVKSWLTQSFEHPRQDGSMGPIYENVYMGECCR